MAMTDEPAAGRGGNARVFETFIGPILTEDGKVPTLHIQESEIKSAKYVSQEKFLTSKWVEKERKRNPFLVEAVARNIRAMCIAAGNKEAAAFWQVNEGVPAGQHVISEREDGKPEQTKEMRTFVPPLVLA